MADNMNVNLGGYSLKVVAIAFLVGLMAGSGGMYFYGPKQTLTQTVEKPVVQEKVVTEQVTKVQYLPGETVYLPSPTPINPNATEPVKLDGKFEIGKPTFTYTLNGKPGQFTKTDDEKYVFDKNMIAFTQTSQVSINVDVPTIDKTKYNAVGPYLTSESWGLTISRDTQSQRLMLIVGMKWDNENGRNYETGGAWQVKF